MKKTAADKSPALLLAERMAVALKQQQYAPGEIIASLPELNASYQVGRPVLRQAVRILEERGIATLRRGAGGGLVALEPNPAYAGRALSILIESKLRHFSDLGVLLESIDYYVYLFHSPLLSAADCVQLRRLVNRLNRLSEEEFLRTQAHHQLACAIRRLVRVPVMELLEKAAYECSLDLIPHHITLRNDRRGSPAWAVTLETVEALVAGDIPWLLDCQKKQRAIMEESWQADLDAGVAAPDAGDGADYPAANSQAERIVRDILRDIRRLGWTEGERIASGVELARRFQTTPDIVRQAIIILQQYGVVAVDKGRAGGLRIAALDRQQMLGAARDYLRDAGSESRSLREFLLQLTLKVVADSEGRQPGQLRRAALASGGGDPGGKKSPASGAGDDLLWLLDYLCDHPVLRTLTELAAPLIGPIGDRDGCRAVLDAFASGDLPMARRQLMDCYADVKS